MTEIQSNVSKKEIYYDNFNGNKSRFERYKILLCKEKMFDQTSNVVGRNIKMEKVELYNACVCSAPPRLYDIYVSLYLNNHTQESLSENIGYTVEYISKLNGQLIRFLQKNLNK